MDKWQALLTDAHARFHAELERIQPEFAGLTAYTSVERASEARGSFAWSWGVPWEIQETINSLNAWGGRVHKWSAWNRVVDSYESADDQWEISDHFVEPIAFFCMLQPSSIAERLLVVAENTLHQANQSVFPDEPDRLDQDRLKRGAVLRRSDRKKQLDRIGKRWSKYPSFRLALDAINDVTYRKLSHNFRDLSAHSFAPRLHLGHIPRAFRTVAPWEDRVQQADGSFLMVPHPTKKMIQYAMSDLPPLSLADARSANLDEYRKARNAMDRFDELIDELCIRMGSKAQGTSTS